MFGFVDKFRPGKRLGERLSISSGVDENGDQVFFITFKGAKDFVFEQFSGTMTSDFLGFIEQIYADNEHLDAIVFLILLNMNLDKIDRFMQEVKRKNIIYDSHYYVDNRLDNNIRGTLYKRLTNKEPEFEYEYTDLEKLGWLDSHSLENHIAEYVIFHSKHQAQVYLEILLKYV